MKTLSKLEMEEKIEKFKLALSMKGLVLYSGPHGGIYYAGIDYIENRNRESNFLYDKDNDPKQIYRVDDDITYYKYYGKGPTELSAISMVIQMYNGIPIKDIVIYEDF